MASSSEADEIAELKIRLAEAEATLDAIRRGEVDAVVVEGGIARDLAGSVEADEAPQVYTLESADLPFRQLVENMADGALSLDRDHSIVYCNGFFSELVGVTREELLGRSFLELVDDDARSAIADAIERGEIVRLQSDLLRAGGERVAAQLTVSPPGVHSPRRTTLMVADRRAQVRLASMTLDRDVAKAENLAKDRFLATLGHELRSPLAAVANGISVLRVKPSEPAVAERVLPSLDRQVRQLRALVDDLLDLTRVAQGKIVLKREPVRLADVIANVAEGLGQSSVRLQTHVEPPGLALVADPMRLEQVVANLVNNAARYSDHATAISIRVRSMNEQVSIEVSDEGIGLASEDLERIFEPFVQVTSMSGGLGIGLSLVRQLVELHGGTIRASSAGKGSGSTFQVLLPNVDAAGKPKPDAPAVRGGGGLRILVVDDNVDAADMLAMLLEVEGHTVLIANTGQSALEVAHAEKPDLALLDLGLPDMSGYEVAKRLRADLGDSILLFAVTGFSHDDARRASAEAGFDEHLVKPISVENVLELLASRGR